MPNKILIGVVLMFLALIIVAGAVLLWPAPKEEIPVIEPKNGEIYNALVALGLDKSVVDVQPTKIIVDVVINDTTNKEGTALYVLGVIGHVIKEDGDDRLVDVRITSKKKETNYGGNVQDIHRALRREITVDQLLSIYTK